MKTMSGVRLFHLRSAGRLYRVSVHGVRSALTGIGGAATAVGNAYVWNATRLPRMRIRKAETQPLRVVTRNSWFPLRGTCLAYATGMTSRAARAILPSRHVTHFNPTPFRRVPNVAARYEPVRHEILSAHASSSLLPTMPLGCPFYHYSGRSASIATSTHFDCKSFSSWR